MAGRAIVSQALAGYRGSVAVRLWDGQLATGRRNAPCTIVFRDPGALRELVLHPDLLSLTEAHLAGAVEVEGDLETLFDLSVYLTQIRLPLAARLRLIGRAWRLPAEGYKGSGEARADLPAHDNSRASVAYHYDVGNDFYALWLDPEYVYSCAYFRDSEQSLAEAQRDKLDYICRKLRLAPGQRLLDIGCGWGALALWAARHHGVHVHGITFSEHQYQLACARVRNEGLSDRVRVELLDYRDLDGRDGYDRIVSVGMFEHIGVRNFPHYFSTVHRLLKPGGLFLNHGITSETGWRRTSLTRFMNRYIFPDGELARISDVMDAMERSGLEPLDVENLRPHYVLTLRHWAHALEANREAAISASSEAIYRLWRLYMAGSTHYFDEGSIGIYQVLAGRVRSSLSVPLRRDDLYVVQAD
ncbi:MAG TPA: class I SAM-dependent methyltransferase [Candidatus Competibacteraceae bacterium]|nr:class I SAM-dependent methyltransferase [Candidatus Competibacteraceae bacterium]